MNEQHTQAYLNLIEQLLNCTSEAELQGSHSLPKLTSILEENIAKFDNNFIKSINDWATANFHLKNPTQISILNALKLMILGYAIRDLNKGSKSNNLEIAAACFENAMQIFTREAFSNKWATCQDALASIYFYRIQGNRLENLKKAIEYCENALTVLSSEDFPEEYEKIQKNLRLIHGQLENEEFKYQLIKIGETPEFITLKSQDFPGAIILIPNPNLTQVQTSDSQIAFLLEVLQAVSDSKGDPEEVYPVLEANLNNLDETFAQTLVDWATFRLAKLDLERAYNIALVIENLSHLILDFLKGNRSTNIEIALKGYEIALTVFTYERFSFDWARTKSNLGNVYSARIAGEQRENLEEAIRCYAAALKEFTRESYPIDWARTTYNLGNAYSKRIEGEQSENQEEAIRHYSATLAVYTRDVFPKDWAESQDALGSAYLDRIAGERRENIEEAIRYHTAALEKITRTLFPSKWANIQNNLGSAYFDRIKGYRRENLEEAIRCYNLALDEFTRKQFPTDWANVMDNLGNAYAERIQGNRRENLEKAIRYSKSALEERPRDHFPVEWARTHGNLGLTYCDRIEGDRRQNFEEAIYYCTAAREVFTCEDFPVEWASAQNNQGLAYLYYQNEGDRRQNLEKAIGCFTAALEVRTRERFPVEWAQTQNNLGLAYYNRIEGKRQDNLKEAIHCYKEALKESTQERFPIEWANKLNNLGLAYCDRMEEGRRINLEEAIHCFFNALKERTRDRLPIDWARTQYYWGIAYSFQGKTTLAIESFRRALEINTPTISPIECIIAARFLGNTAFDAKLWNIAIEGYATAVESVEQIRAWAITEQRKEQTLARVIEVYHRLVQAWINVGQIDKAIEYVERSKARNLVELLTMRDRYPDGATPELCEQLDRMRRELIQTQQQLDIEETRFASGIIAREERLNTASDVYATNRERLNELRQQFDRFIEDKIRPIDLRFSLTQKVEPIPFNDIQSLIDEGTTIVEWYITGDKILTFLITHNNSNPQVCQFPTQDLTNLVNWVNGYLRTYYNNRDQWKTELETSLKKLAEILHLEEILSHVSPECDRLILIPHRFLHILPLHALPVSPQVGRGTGGEGKYLLDLFPRGVQYAPSCQLLKLVKSQQRPDFQNLFAIQNPTDNLISADLEVETICSFFSPNAEVLEKKSASEASLKVHKNLPLANCVHFSCHGQFNPISPLESALVLSKDEANTEDGYLTLAEIFELSLSKCRLVTLSACETGFTDLQSLSDEYIGLPSGFLFAGSLSVVSSLWTVDDFSTAFLMIKFYENLRTEQKSQEKNVAVALKDAQNWLRNLTPETGEEFFNQIEPYIDGLYPDQPRSAKACKTGALNRIKKCGNYPFANPFNWAAFTATGF